MVPFVPATAEMTPVLSSYKSCGAGYEILWAQGMVQMPMTALWG